MKITGNADLRKALQVSLQGALATLSECAHRTQCGRLCRKKPCGYVDATNQHLMVHSNLCNDGWWLGEPLSCLCMPAIGTVAPLDMTAEQFDAQVWEPRRQRMRERLRARGVDEDRIEERIAKFNQDI